MLLHTTVTHGKPPKITMKSVLLNENILIKAAAVFILSIIVYKLVSFIKNLLRSDRIPGPMGFPIVGNIYPKLSHKSIFNHKEKYGDVSSLTIFGNKIVILHSVEATRELLTSPEHADTFSHRGVTYYRNEFAPDSIIWRSANEEYWKEQKYILGKIIHEYGESIDELYEVTMTELENVKEILRKNLKTEINLNDIFTPSIINSVLSLVTGRRYDYDDNIIRSINNGLEASNPILAMFMDKILLKFPLARKLSRNVATLCREIEEFRDVLRKVAFYECREEYRKGSKLQGVTRALLEKQETSDWLEDKLIIGIVQDLLSAGTISTKWALLTAFLIFVHHPEHQSKIQNEIDVVVGRERYVDLVDRKRMPYTQAVILELLRYVPIIPMGGIHTCHKDTKFRSFKIEKNTTVLQNVYRIHHDRTLWEDPDTFDPTRFMKDGELKSTSDDVYKNCLTFSLGKRRCMGESFVKSRLFLYIATLLQNFTFVAVQPLPSYDPLTFQPEFLIHPEEYKVKIIERKKSD